MRRDGPKARAFAAKRGQLARNPDRGLKRDAELRSSEASRRAFAERGRESAARSLRESAVRAARASAPREGPLSPAVWRASAFTASGGSCILSGTRARDVEDRRFHVHHPLPKGELRARGLHGFVWDERNALWLLARLHLQHETPGVRDEHRIGRAALPASVWAFCAELDALAGTEWATVMVERLHPLSGRQPVARKDPAAGSSRSGNASPKEGA